MLHNGLWEAIFRGRECQKWIRSVIFVQIEPVNAPNGPTEAQKVKVQTFETKSDRIIVAIITVITMITIIINWLI